MPERQPRAPVNHDYNATAPLRPEAASAIAEALGVVGNPSSVHAFGRAARRIVEDARERVAALIGASPAEIVFTSGGTEANGLALGGTGRGRILVSAIEHDSILACAGSGDRIAVDTDGILAAAALDSRIQRRADDALVSVMLANNETGAIQPVPELAGRIHAASALFHCDAVQAAGKIAVDVRALDVDLMSLSAHKLGGPKGVGALYVSERITLSAQLRGGGQERGRRAGTENVAGIAGFGAAAAAARRDLADCARLATLRDRLAAEVTRAYPQAFICARRSARLPNTSCIALPGFASETQVMALDLDGVAVSAGSACSSGKIRVSHVLAAMGAPPEHAASAIRVSLGWGTAPTDIDRFLEAWRSMAARREAA